MELENGAAVIGGNTNGANGPVVNGNGGNASGEKMNGADGIAAKNGASTTAATSLA